MNLKKASDIEDDFEQKKGDETTGLISQNQSLSKK
jgi:hypothetical protein